jgi:hypothetical protein
MTIPARDHSAGDLALFSIHTELRGVEILMAECGIADSCETVRRRVNRFGPMIAIVLCTRRPEPRTAWYIDGVYPKIAGRMVYLWRAGDGWPLKRLARHVSSPSIQDEYLAIA